MPQTAPAQGQTKLNFTGSGNGFGRLTIGSASGTSQMVCVGSTIRPLGVAILTADDFLF